MNAPMTGPHTGMTAFEDRVTPDTIDLFMYSAATWITHRTHYEKEFAIAEGHEGVLIHGPLLGAYMIERLQDWAAGQGGSLRSIQYRHQAPAVAGTVLEIAATVKQVEDLGDRFSVTLAVALDKAGEGPCTAAEAKAEIPKTQA